MTEESYYSLPSLEDLQTIDAIIQTTNVISYSLLFNLGRQYLSESFEQAKSIKPVKHILRKSFFLRIKAVDSSVATSPQEQLKALRTTLSACHNPGDNQLAFIISSDGRENKVYFGTHSQDKEFFEDLKHFLKVNLPSTQLNDCNPKDEIFKADSKNSQEHTFKYASALTGIPSPNLGIHPEHSHIDNLLTSLHGSPFIYMLIAEPMAEAEVNRIIDNLHELMGQIYSSGGKVMLDKTFTQDLSEKLEQIKTTSKENSIERSKSGEQSRELSLKSSLEAEIEAKLAPTFNPVALAAKLKGNVEIQNSVTHKNTKTDSQVDTTKEENNVNQATENKQSAAQTLSREFINVRVQETERQIQQYIERLKLARALGCWNVSVYFLAENSKIAQRAVKQLRGLLSGEKSLLEPIRVHDLESILDLPFPNDLDKKDYTVLTALRNFQQPSLALVDPKNPKHRLNHPLGSAFNGLTTPLNTEELSMLINLPKGG
ncbi:hypothetical protein [Scytonema sp. NUACC26]|uniref:hypothetical protein n=1 Tax=Scytonema sp. NUACC26 TaxID=3140176 RepID=UPI0034DC664D